jgi:hypothetical protein
MLSYLVSNSMRLVSTGTFVSRAAEGRKGGGWMDARRTSISPLVLLQALPVGVWGGRMLT